jgi:hypothetical protein
MTPSLPGPPASSRQPPLRRWAQTVALACSSMAIGAAGALIARGVVPLPRAPPAAAAATIVAIDPTGDRRGLVDAGPATAVRDARWQLAADAGHPLCSARAGPAIPQSAPRPR